ncbi:MAG: pyrimidine 5'-nucleotidase, partial [Mariprofundaceae bacterium]|nr:pyrimidine 5'-nucleotidase [Mariprofundaceae bacterium]
MPIDLIIVDLDNTLYAADNGVFSRMDKRMTAFICHALNMKHAEANALRVRYWRQYGTTLRGL